MEQLTKKERLVMDTLWNSKIALSASEIMEVSNENLNINTIQQVLRHLLSNNFIEVAEYGFNKKSIMRKYKPVVSQANYINSFISGKNRFEVLCGLVDQEENIDSLNELQKYIDDKKKKLGD